MIEIGRIEDVFDVGSSKRVFKSEWTNEGVPFYRAREVVKLSKDGFVDNELYISEEMFQEYAKKYGVPKKGDILVTGVGTLGICYQVKENDRFYFKDGNIVWLKNKGKVCADYIVYCYKSPFVKRQIKSTATAAVVGTYTITNARETEIPLPPLPQQKKIAAILDAADAYRQKTKALIAKYEELTQSLFLDMFGDPVTNPMGWEVEPFEEMVRFDTHMTKDFNKYGHLLHVGIKNIEKTTGKIVGCVSAKEEGLTSGKYLFDDRHIIYSKIRPNLNKVALPDFNGLCSADSYPLLPVEGVSNRVFIAFLLRSECFVDFILQHSTRTNIPKANRAQMKLFIGISPPFKLQNQFAERAKAIETQKLQAQTSLKKAEDLFNSLLQKAFKGELI